MNFEEKELVNKELYKMSIEIRKKLEELEKLKDSKRKSTLNDKDVSFSYVEYQKYSLNDLLKEFM